jgi:1-acyl-sn-glycerol-3-phosphate acyltransferase
VSEHLPALGRAPREFIPAKPRRAVILGLEWLNRLIALPWLQIRLNIDPSELALLQGLPSPAGVVLACNHPTFADPAVIFEVTRRWGRICNYMAAREIFDRFGTGLGRVIRRAGAFSVRRGGSNAYAEGFAVRTLREAKYPVVVYPEGHTFYLNDVLLPLKPGVAAWPLKAASEPGAPPMFVVPVVIKYCYTGSLEQPLDEAVRALEDQVLAHRDPVPTGPFYPRLYLRLHRIAHHILSAQEHRYGYFAPPEASIDERVSGLCAHIVGQLERKYLGQVHAGAFFDRARHLMVSTLEAAGQQASPTIHHDALAARFAWALSTFYAGYLQPDSPPERFAETVMKLHREITQRVPLRFRAWKQARVRIGEPIPVGDFVAGYSRDQVAGSHDTVQHLLLRISASMQTLLDECNVAIAEERAQR